MALLEKLEEGLKNEEAEPLARAAHTLKSNSAQLGAKDLSELCKELETRARESSLEQCGPLLVKISEELRAVHEALMVEQLGESHE